MTGRYRMSRTDRPPSAEFDLTSTDGLRLACARWTAADLSAAWRRLRMAWVNTSGGTSASSKPRAATRFYKRLIPRAERIWKEYLDEQAKGRPSVLPVWQELAVHDDPDPIPLRIRHPLQRHLVIDGAHDAVAKLLVDQLLPRRPVDLHQLVEAVDGRVDRDRGVQRPAHRHHLKQRHLVVGEPEKLRRLLRLLLVHRHLSEERRRRPHGAPAHLLGDLRPGEAFLQLGCQHLLRQLGSSHCAASRAGCRSVVRGASLPAPLR